MEIQILIRAAAAAVEGLGVDGTRGEAAAFAAAISGESTSRVALAEIERSSSGLSLWTSRAARDAVRDGRPAEQYTLATRALRALSDAAAAARRAS